MLTRADLDEFDAVADPILTAAEKAIGLHDGKYWAFEGRKPASRALRYEMVLFPEVKNRELAQRYKVTERAVKKQRCLLRSRLSAMAKLREAESSLRVAS
ncbi:MAG TPA: hypothetical protein VKE29_06265 [Candidatus Udaeobacter sp.]|nr:hypothetical protein [Candidatus Udaeobacter sp.]